MSKNNVKIRNAFFDMNFIFFKMEKFFSVNALGHCHMKNVNFDQKIWKYFGPKNLEIFLAKRTGNIFDLTIWKYFGQKKLETLKIWKIF